LLVSNPPSRAPAEGAERPSDAQSGLTTTPGLTSRERVSATSEFLALLKRRERGRLKVYIGSSAGTGKTYRMLQEAHALRKRGVDIVMGRRNTRPRGTRLIGDLEVIPGVESSTGVVLEETRRGGRAASSVGHRR
jgi:hypothetical protein